MCQDLKRRNFPFLFFCWVCPVADDFLRFTLLLSSQFPIHTSFILLTLLLLLFQIHCCLIFFTAPRHPPSKSINHNCFFFSLVEEIKFWGMVAASTRWGVVFVMMIMMVVVEATIKNPLTLNLERAFPTSHGVDFTHLKERDRLRHGRLLQQQQQQQSSSPSNYVQQNGVVDFSVEGTFDPFLVGLYFTRVQLGSPPREFYVQIDTGSDVLWVGCNSCTGCPTSSGLKIQLELFDPSSSSTSSLIPCSHQLCSIGIQSADASCSNGNQCSYTFQYGDGSGTSGYYVSDLMHFDTIVGSSLTSNSSAPVFFGCSTSQTGDLTKSERAVDGIFGFGQQSLSVISQLASQGVTPNAFSHCLQGNNGGGGILVLGVIMEPNIVYSPLVPSQPHYNLNLQSITVNGQKLPIDQSVFATSSSRGTIIDSGTTLAYLAEEAYDPFVNAISQYVSQSVRAFVSKGNQCYIVTSSISDTFPVVGLNFAGGATMVINPQDYLLQQNSIGGAAVWCIGFQKIQGQGLTILGDLVLKDKIVVYDLAAQRIGWANYDCSSAVNVSTTTSNGKSEFVNAGQQSNNVLPQKHDIKPIVAFAALLAYTSIIWTNLFL